MENTIEEVSIIIPAYNNQLFIRECLESLLKNRPDRIEVAILDDGSTDATYDIAKDWIEKNKYLFKKTILVRQENAGITATLNKLIQLTECEFIAVLAGDDRLLPGSIDSRVYALKENNDWLAVFGDCEVISDSSDKIYDSGIESLYPKRISARKSALLDKDNIVLELILRWSVPGPVFMARRKAYSETAGVGKYNESFTTEDRDFYLRLIAKNSLGFIDVKVAAYRLHSSSAVQDKIRKKSVQDSVIESEKTNLVNFKGMHYLALYTVSKYHVGIALFKSGDRFYSKFYGLFMAFVFFCARYFIDLYQRYKISC